MNGKKLRLGLVGKDVSKSDSGRIHTFLLTELGYEVEYENISTNSDDFDSVVRYLMGDLTSPFPTSVILWNTWTKSWGTRRRLGR